MWMNFTETRQIARTTKIQKENKNKNDKNCVWIISNITYFGVKSVGISDALSHIKIWLSSYKDISLFFKIKIYIYSRVTKTAQKKSANDRFLVRSFFFFVIRWTE